jgi:hypothetical protein
LGQTFGEVRDAASPLRPEAHSVTTIQITLTINGDDISGVAAGESGPPTHFHGWLGLMSAVDALVRSGADALASPPGDGGGESTRAQH